MMISKFELNEDQIEKFDTWKENQLKKNKDELSFVGGRWSFTFTQTGIGICVVAVDNLLKEETVLTDLESW